MLRSWLLLQYSKTITNLFLTLYPSCYRTVSHKQHVLATVLAMSSDILLQFQLVLSFGCELLDFLPQRFQGMRESKAILAQQFELRVAGSSKVVQQVDIAMECFIYRLLCRVQFFVIFKRSSFGFFAIVNARMGLVKAVLFVQHSGGIREDNFRPIFNQII